jgi:hypothetical protein
MFYQFWFYKIPLPQNLVRFSQKGVDATRVRHKVDRAGGANTISGSQASI